MRSPLEKQKKKRKKGRKVGDSRKAKGKRGKSWNNQAAWRISTPASNCCPSCSRDEGGTDMLFLNFLYILPTTTELLIVQVLFMSIDVH